MAVGSAQPTTYKDEQERAAAEERQRKAKEKAGKNISGTSPYESEPVSGPIGGLGKALQNKIEALKQIKQDKQKAEREENVPWSGYNRGSTGPTQWTQDEANRVRAMGDTGIDRNYTPNMFNRDAVDSDRQKADLDKFMRGRAEGKDLISERTARLMTDQTRRGIASQARGTGTRYNPALQAQANRAQASAGQNIAAQTAVAKAQEQQAAQSAYMASQAGIRQQDQGALGQGLASEGQDADYRKFMENLGANYQSLGLSESFADQANRQAYYDRLMKMWAVQNGYDLNTGKY